MPFVAKNLFVPAFLVFICALASCSIVPKPAADTTRHYVLSSSPTASSNSPSETTSPPPALATATAPDKPILGLRQIEMPAYLSGNKSIAVRENSNEIVYHENDRWAEPLDEGIARIVRERLLANGAVSAVKNIPGYATRSYDLRIRILECEGVNTNNSAATRFTAEYEFSTPAGAPLTGTFRYTAPATTWDGKDFAALARQLSDSATALAAEIEKNEPQKF